MSEGHHGDLLRALLSATAAARTGQDAAARGALQSRLADVGRDLPGDALHAARAGKGCCYVVLTHSHVGRHGPVCDDGVARPPAAYADYLLGRPLLDAVRDVVPAALRASTKEVAWPPPGFVMTGKPGRAFEVRWAAD
jgi:hypothetical protein